MTGGLETTGDTGGSAVTEEVRFDPLRLGAFDLEHIVGQGGMGVVWAGHHPQSGLPVAIKVMTARQFQRERHRAALANEVRATARLAHPGIVLLFDQGLVDAGAAAASGGRLATGSPYVVMEYVSGGTLAERPPRSWGELRSVLLEVLAGLGHAHARGLVHRDIKPGNVLIAAEGDLRSGVRLTDWGIAWAGNEADEREPGLGTLQYMAPEQILGRWRDQGPWTDLYSLGCMAWRLASGAFPFAAETPTGVARRHVESPPEDFEPWMALPPAFEDWLRHLLAKSPEGRFQRAADAAAALLGLGEVTGEPAEASPRPLFGLRALTRRETVPAYLSEAPPNALVDSVGTSTAERLGALESDLPPAAHGERPRAAPLSEDWRPEPGVPRLPALAGAGLTLFELRAPPLVGRLPLRDRLWRNLVQVAHRQRAGAVLITAPRGAGASRLAEWLGRRADELGSATLVPVEPGLRGSSASGLRLALSRLLRCRGLPAPDLELRVRAWLTERGEDDVALARQLASWLSNQAAPGRATRHALGLRVLQLLAAERPVVLWLDDLHENLETQEFLARLLEDQDRSPSPILAVATWVQARADDGPNQAGFWPRLSSRPEVEWIELPPLDDEEQRLLLDQLLGLDPALRADVVRRSAGNPLFAVQLVGDAVRRQLLVPGSRGWSLAPQADQELPADLHALWCARLDGATAEVPEVRPLLELAATLGLEVRRQEWLASAAAAGLELRPQSLDCLERHRLIDRTEAGWRLAHSLLREVLLQLAEASGRLGGWHGHIAGVLGPEDPERLGRHLLAAGLLEPSIAPLFEGASRRRERGDYAEALDLLDARDRALGTLTADPEGAAHERARGDVLRARIAGHRTEFEAVVSLCEPVLQAASSRGWSDLLPEAMRTLAFAWWQRGRYDDAEGLYRDALPLFEALDAPEGVGRCQLGLGIAAYQRGEFEAALARARTAHGVFEAAGITQGVVDALGWAAILERRVGRSDQALRLLEEAVAVADAAGLRFGAAMVRNSLAVAFRAAGRLREARVLFHQVLDETELLGSGEAVWPRINLGLLALQSLHHARAREHLDQALELLETMGRVTFAGGVHVALVAAAGLARDWSAWDRHAAAAEEALARAPMPHDDIASSATLAARVASEAREIDRAKGMYAVAVAQRIALGEDATALQAELAELA